MRVEHNGLTRFAEAAPISVLAGRNHANAHEDPSTSASLVYSCFTNHTTILSYLPDSVNEWIVAVFPPCQPRDGVNVLGHAKA
jgi:hypothetical protein